MKKFKVGDRVKAPSGHKGKVVYSDDSGVLIRYDEYSDYFFWCHHTVTRLRPKEKSVRVTLKKLREAWDNSQFVDDKSALSFFERLHRELGL